ncbi:IclR family transcriptional regulator [Halegenticoccus soli]|uniref:IclR family transcriptional regulator n=1 Tax=Halegenticoccus soli TaxID=1985678 RepID=UPI000C6E40CE|nr:IclR family transcriptional regulator [Halegenticoccus soli]
MTPNGTEAGSGRTIRAVQISCDVLRALREMDGAGVTELADRLGLSKGTVHGHLNTLHRNEFVVKDGDDYRVSLQFVDFGEHAKENVKVYDVARKETEELAEKSGEFAQFMVEEHGWGVYLHKVNGANAVKTASYVGNRKHLHCTALGKAILSELPRERVDEIVEARGLPRQTENTITDREGLYDELERIRERGIAYDDEEVLQGLRCVAAPLTGYDGTLYGAISVSGPISRMKGERYREEVPEMVQSAANVIEINAAHL